jgi:hypothetical protein
MKAKSKKDFKTEHVNKETGNTNTFTKARRGEPTRKWILATECPVRQGILSGVQIQEMQWFRIVRT